MITAVVLAAGTSSRFGGDNKLLQPFAGGTVLRASLRAVFDSGLDNVVVVTGYQQDEVRAALADLPVTFAHNPRYRAGEQVSSVKTGLTVAADMGAQAALILLGDMPLLPATVIKRIARAYELGCGDIVAPRHGAVRGHPVLIDRRFWPEAHALPDGAPMRQLLAAHPESVALLQVNTDRVLRDVDTQELYREARQIADQG